MPTRRPHFSPPFQVLQHIDHRPRNLKRRQNIQNVDPSLTDLQDARQDENMNSTNVLPNSHILKRARSAKPGHSSFNGGAGEGQIAWVHPHDDDTIDMQRTSSANEGESAPSELSDSVPTNSVLAIYLEKKVLGGHFFLFTFWSTL